MSSKTAFPRGPHAEAYPVHPSHILLRCCCLPLELAGLSSSPFFPTPFPNPPHNGSRSLQETEQDQQARIRALMDSSQHKVIGIGVVLPEERRPFCVECRTTATPMWRGGPTGPRSLCNACGIRYRKKRRQELGLDNKQQQQLVQPQPPQQQQGHQHLQRDLSEATSAVKDGSSTKSSSLQVVKKRRVLMGVEEAAILLMALSSSSTSPTLLHG